MYVAIDFYVLEKNNDNWRGAKMCIYKEVLEMSWWVGGRMFELDGGEEVADNKLFGGG